MENREVFLNGQIRKAGQANLALVWGIIRECAEDLSNKGFTHWSKYYRESLVARMLEKKDVYLWGEVGTMTMGLELPWYYSKEDINCFSEAERPGICISALAVRPDCQNAGIGGKLVDFAINHAKQRGIEWVRLDCRLIPSLERFYKNMGFNEVGRMYEGNDDEEVYLLMEKRVDAGG
ncbi:GNAT family N-acetyltransferase [Candidatus Collierbacteria bacterium]|nr:GNAT family N-acetyltransferase [Candidatus Collierbacteria bacterium]